MRDETQDKTQAIASMDEIAFRLSDDKIREVVAAVRAQDADTVHALLDDLNIPDTADLIAMVGEDERKELLSMYSHAFNPLVFTEMDYELRRISLSAMPAANVAGIISALESDDALDLLINLDPAFQQEVIHKLSAKMRMALEEGLSFPEESAGRLMQREVVAVPQFWTVGKTIDYLRAAAMDLPEDFFDIFVIDPGYHILGQIPLGRLVRSNRSVKIETLMQREFHAVPAEMDQEEVSYLFKRGNITSAPVTDSENRLIGVITIDDIVDVIDEEAQEDFLKMAGVENDDLYRATLSTTGTRFRWLFVNLLTAILASVVISWFGATMEQIIALAILMPIVASMGGNAGTQTLTIAVRALATRQLSGANIGRIIWKETLVGALNGMAFAVIAGVITAIWFASPMLGVVIAGAMVINLFAAGVFGACIPILLHRMGSDPAISSTVFLTTITDVVGFFAFLGLGALLLM